ncbi:Probable allantoinase 1 [Galdieria sulphuraria]|nr:Probable allantoinase 1 [Galdieria sulphuraria]
MSQRETATNQQPFLGVPSSQSAGGIPYLKSFLVVVVAILITSIISWQHAKIVQKGTQSHVSFPCGSFSVVSFPFVLRSTRVVTENGTFPASIFVDRNGLISRVVPGLVEDSSWGCLHDVGDLVIMPGLIDPHVHVNEPGTKSEGFNTATLAAAAGACTTYESILEKRRINPSDSCGDQIFRAGVVALKSFTIDSQAYDFPPVSIQEAEQVMRALRNLSIDGEIRYMIHAELASSKFSPNNYEGPSMSYMAFMRSRPDSFEVNAVQALIELSRKTHCPVYIVHISSADAAELVKQAKEEGIQIFAETCTQYLAFAADDIPDGHPEFKCVPPIRPNGNRKRLLRYLLQDNLFDLIASDHAPATPEEKCLEQGNVRMAYAGISGLQYRLPAVWTALRSYGVTFEQLSYWLSLSAARIFHVDDRKGRIASGMEADFVIWDPESLVNITENWCFHRHKKSAFLGKQYYGEVKETFFFFVAREIFKSDAERGKLELSSNTLEE